MWIKGSNQLIQVTDTSREEVEFRASRKILESFDNLAEKNDSYRNYVIENGLRHLLNEDELIYDRKNRPKDRIRYRTTLDKELVVKLKEAAKTQKLYIGDIIESCYGFVQEEEIVNKEHRYRVEE